MRFYAITATPHRHRGAILVMALVVLLVMSLLSVSAIDTQSLQSQMARQAAISKTLYHLTRSALVTELQALDDDRYRRRIMTTAGGAQPTLVLTQRLLTGVNGGDYRQQGTISLVDTSIRAINGYSSNKALVRLYEISITTTEINSGQSSHQTLGVAHISLPGG